MQNEFIYSLTKRIHIFTLKRNSHIHIENEFTYSHSKRIHIFTYKTNSHIHIQK